MSTNSPATLARLIDEDDAGLLNAWIDAQNSVLSRRRDLIDDADLRAESADFLRLFGMALRTGTSDEAAEPAWDNVRGLVADLSRSRAVRGFSPSETATFVQSLKVPLFGVIRERIDDPVEATDAVVALSQTLDRLGLYTTEVYQRAREEVIKRQQEELLELSTPVVKLWDGILALPLIGTLDSARTQVVMESLLQRIVETNSPIAIIDITGVPTVDTLVAQHLLKTVAAARLMGADCIISGIRPQIAQTIVHLGVELGDVVTKATMADAVSVALDRLGYVVSRRPVAG